MKILIDASAANRPQKTGVEWYAFQMIMALKNVIPSEVEVVLYTRQPLSKEFKNLPHNWKHKRLHWPTVYFWSEIRFSWEMIFSSSDDVLFVPASTPPFFHPKLVTTIHDVGLIARPELYPPRAFVMQKWSMRRAVGADLVCTPSEFSKQEIIKYFDIAENRIAVVPNAPVISDHKRSVEAHTKDDDEKRNALVYIGRVERKKNIITMVRSFEILKRSGKHDDLKLVIAGGSGYGYDEIKDRIENSHFSTDIHLLGYISESKKQELLAQARVLLLPSWYEGFGMPILEAQSYQTPVIASDIPPHREIAGRSIAYASPENAREWARFIENYPSSLQNNKNERDFTWDSSAKLWWASVRRLQSVN